MKPLHRGGGPPIGSREAVAAEARDLLRRMKEDEGDRKRRNAVIIKDKLRSAWQSGGDGLEDFRRLLRDATKD